MSDEKLPMEEAALRLFGVQFLLPDGTYRGLLPDGTPHPHPEALVDLFDCLTEAAQARFRRGYRLVLYGQVDVLHLMPQTDAPAQAVKTS